MKKKDLTTHTTLKKIRLRNVQRSWTAALAVVVVIAGIGAYVLFGSHAATPSTSTAEAESGTKSGTTSIIADSGASGGNALKFGTAASSGGSGASCTSNCQPVGTISGHSGSWTQKFDDEFNGSSLDTSKWGATDGYNTNGVTTHSSNLSFSGGSLILTLASSSSGAEICSAPSCGAGSNAYTVPVGGYAEARVYFPGNGNTIYNWPAWWISGDNWPANGENDIAEGLGGNLTVNYHSNGSCNANHGEVSGTWSNGYHTYGIYRQSGKADVYYDGTLVKSYCTDDSGGGEALIVNVGNGNTSVYGTGSQVKVDYIRAWQ